MISIHRCFLIAALTAPLVAPARAQGDTDPLDHHTHHGADAPPLHFTHPMISETPTPDRKIRFDYMFQDKGGNSEAHIARLEAEYAFNPNVGVEFDIPYQWNEPSGQPSQNNLGNIEVGIKLASFALAQYGIVFGGGIELGLPTGDDDKAIGNDHTLEVEPFINAGFKHDNLEVIGFVGFGIPTNEPEEEKNEEDLEISFNLSLLYHVTPNVAGLLEIDGHTVASGEEEQTVVNLTPGVIIQPTDDPNLHVGVGVSFPISNDDLFDAQVTVSVFRHF